MMFSYPLFVTLAAAAVAVATPALADPREAPPMPAPAATVAPEFASSTPRAVSSRQRYCVMQSITGSRIARRVCDTREGWMNFGFDPLAAK